MKRYFKQIIFLGLLITILPFAKALPTFIEGQVINGNGLLIRASIYSDQLSFQEDILDQYEIDTSEFFELGFEIAEIQEVFIRIGNQQFSFFAEAGKSYQVRIENVEIPPTSALNKQESLHLFWKEKNALNEAIDNFNYKFGTFLEANFVELYKYRDGQLLQTFEKEIIEKLNNTNNLKPREKGFFENLITYQLADLKNASRTVSKLKLGETYFKNKEILYNHPGYMLFFNQYFTKYFKTGKKGINYNEFVDRVRNGNSSHELLDYIGNDPILIQERLRELVLLNTLKEVYYSKDFNSTQVETVLKEISEMSKFIEHQKIASAILKQLSQLQIGAQAPLFNLKSTKGGYKNLDDYKGRYVYLFFMSENCKTCDTDLASIKSLQEKYKSNIAVLEVFVNFTKSGLAQVMKKGNPTWDRLLFENNFDLLNTYRVRTYPLYILLDRESNILLNPAKKPQEGIDKYFDFLIKKDADKEKKHDILFR